MKYDLQTDMKVLAIAGIDAKSFLNSLITNALKESSIYTFILSPNGRYLFDFFIHILQEEYLIEVHKSLYEDLIEKLNFYKLRRKVDIYDKSQELSVLYTHEKSHDFEYVSCMQDVRYNLLGQRIIIRKDLEKLYKPSNIYIVDKYQYSIPDGYSDMGQNKSIILEFGAELLSAISYSKGCFPGQELMARAKYSNRIKKTPYKITAIDEATFFTIEKNTPILDDLGNAVGSFCSGQNDVGIAIAKSDLVGPEKIAYLNNKKIKLEIPQWLV